MYPLGHPHLQESTERFVNRLSPCSPPATSLAIGVARHQLIVAGVATDPRNALLSDLARRLHRHRIATLRFERGITPRRRSTICWPPWPPTRGDDGPFGLRPGAGSGWTHLNPAARAQPAVPAGGRGGRGAPETPGRRALARAWPTWRSPPTAARPTTPTIRCWSPARSTAQPEQVAYDRVVLDYLGQIADEMSGRQGAWEPRRARAGLPPGHLAQARDRSAACSRPAPITPSGGASRSPPPRCWRWTP